MARMKSPQPKVKVHVALPQELYAKIRLLLYEPHYERGFRPAAFSSLIVAALEEFLQKKGPR